MQFSKAGFSLSQLRRYLNGKIDVSLAPLVNGAVDLGGGGFNFRDGNFTRQVSSGAVSLGTYHKEVFTQHQGIVPNNLQPFFSINQGANTCTAIRAELMFYNNNVQPAYFGWQHCLGILSADSAGVDQSKISTLFSMNYNINATVLDLSLNPSIIRTGSNGVATFRVQPTSSGSASPANLSVFGKFVAVGLDAQSLTAL